MFFLGLSVHTVASGGDCIRLFGEDHAGLFQLALGSKGRGAGGFGSRGQCFEAETSRNLGFSEVFFPFPRSLLLPFPLLFAMRIDPFEPSVATERGLFHTTEGGGFYSGQAWRHVVVGADIHATPGWTPVR